MGWAAVVMATLALLVSVLLYMRGGEVTGEDAREAGRPTKDARSVDPSEDG